MTSHDATPQPGWYPDPAGHDQYRYWSGDSWTNEVKPLVSESEQDANQAAEAPAAPPAVEDAPASVDSPHAPALPVVPVAPVAPVSQQPSHQIPQVSLPTMAPLAPSQHQTLPHQYLGTQNPGPIAPSAAYGIPAPVSAAPRGPSFFRSLFDFSFEEVLSIKFARVIFIIGIAVNVFAWIGSAVGWLIVGAILADNYVSPLIPNLLGVGTLLLGWLGALINVILLRVCLELVISQVRTAQHTATLAAAQTQDADQTRN